MTALGQSNVIEQPKVKVAALVRVSTPGQATDDRAGIPRQLAAIDRVVRLHRLEVTETIELVVSGTETRQHPEIIRLCAMLEDGQISGVVMADLDRLMRPDTFADYQLLDVFVTANARIYLESCVHDCSSAMGKFQLMISLFMAGNERQTILHRMNGARRVLMEQGAHVWGKRQLPLGIDYDRKTQVYSFTPDIQKIQEAFRLIDEEGLANIREIGRRLGIAERTLHRLLRNPLYSGFRVYEFTRAKKQVRSKRGKFYHPKVPLAVDQKIRVQVMKDPAIPDARWDRVQSILKAKGKPWKAKREILPLGNILRGLTFCAKCGSRLYLAGDRRRPKTMGYYYCSQNHYRTRSKSGGCGTENQRQITLMEATLEFTGTALAKPGMAKAILQHGIATQRATASEPVPDAHETTGASDWVGRQKRLHRLFEMGQLNEAELQGRLDQLNIEKESFNTRLEAKKAALKAVQADKILDAVSARILRGAMAFKRITDPNWQHRALKGLFKEIHYENGQITAFKLREDMFPADVCEDGIQSDSDSSRPRA
jgi:DNA invertase Pin-like site-specific DNA recombinase